MKKILNTLILLCCAAAISAQTGGKILDRVIAVVGNSVVLESELETQVLQIKLAGQKVDESTKCKILEQMLFRKLLLAQAQHDSVTVTDDQVEQEMDRRFRVYLYQFGSVENFEKFYGKTVDQYKEDFRDDIRDILLAQKMQQKIAGDLSVSPSEVKKYFESLPPDSVPFINAEIEIGELVRKPKENPELRKYAHDKVEELRTRALNGEDFDALVRSYNEDPGSNGQNGAPIKYTNIARGTFVTEFDQYAFSMKPGEISPVFETSYGFHVMKLLARRGEVVDLQHILVTVPVDPQGLQKAREWLDSICVVMKKDSTRARFIENASRYSDEEDSKVNGGKIVNPNTGDTRFQLDELSEVDPTLVLTIEKLKLGEMSEPLLYRTHDQKQAYRVLYIFTRTEPHKENMKQDYLRIQSEALQDKEQRIFNEWISKKLGSTYVRVVDDYKSCPFDNKWVK